MRLLAWLVLAMLLGRFALPAGFMPVVQGADGRIALSLCSGQNVPGWVVPKADGADGAFSPDEAAPGDVCPFGLLALQTLTPDTDLQPVQVASTVLVFVAPAHRALPALPATGPPLGPRGPPPLPV